MALTRHPRQTGMRSELDRLEDLNVSLEKEVRPH